jgi:hypothetical protein
MLLETHSRFFVRHEVRFRSARDAGVPLPFVADDDSLDAAHVLERAMKAGKAVTEIRPNDVVRLTAMEVRPKDEMAVLLFRRSDPNAADPIYENRKTLKLRASGRQPEEAPAVSAHLFIQLENLSDVNPTYRAILEEVPGIGRTYVHNLIASVLRGEKYSYKDKRGKDKEAHTVLDFHGVKSEKLVDALRGSSVPFITLTRPGNITGLDAEGQVVPRDETMRLVIRAKPDQQAKLVTRIKSWANKQDWTDVKVQIDLPENRTRIVSIAREADASDILFVRSEQVEVKKPLAACTDVINEELFGQAKAMFRRDMKGK